MTTPGPWTHTDDAPKPRRVVIGTAYFVSMTAALDYYRPYGYGHNGSLFRAVERKIADGEIHIGKPACEPHERLVLLDNGRRYGIETVM